MCGIVGSVDLELYNDDVRRLSHRGPDSHGLEQIACSGHRIWLGHTRLAIQDLSSAGHQPMKIDGDFIVFNGEIYNHHEIRKLNMIDYNSNSDTETLLKALIVWGLRAIDQLNGIYSFAYFSAQNKKLYLVRDPEGTKPLYYSVQGDKLSFASEICALHKSIRKEHDEKYVEWFLKMRYVPSPYTVYKGINKVPPGHCLEWDIESATYIIYPVFDYQSRNQDGAIISANVDEYQGKLANAVKSQLISDVDVGVLLSGGVDSALIAQYAMEASAKRMKAFSVGFGDEYTECELNDAKETAKYLGMEFVPIRISKDDFFEKIEDICSIVEEPLATTSIIPMYYLCQQASRHVKVVLSGQGADEPLGGYNKYIWHRRAAALSGIIPGTLLNMLKRRRGEGFQKFVSLLQLTGVEKYVHSTNLFSNELLLCCGNSIDDKEIKDRYSYWFSLLGLRKWDVESFMALDIVTSLADDLLMYTDKISMRFALETRVPFLDKNLLSYFSRLPIHKKVDFSRGKIIQKELASIALPSMIIRRKKKGFLSPTNEWFKANTSQLESMMLKSDAIRTFFEPSAIRMLLSRHKLQGGLEKQIFSLLSLHYSLKCIDN